MKAPDAQPSSSDILVVDDNPANLLAIDAALGELAGRVAHAGSGEDALRALFEHDFAVILLDVQMPTLDGFETAKLIRQRKRSRHTPIIFVTAHDRDHSEVLAAYELGAVDFLFKPLVAEVLRAKVAVFVELQQRTSEIARQSELLLAHEKRAQQEALQAERRRWEEEALRKQLQELAETDKRKNEFLAVLSHELRTPLASIVTGMEVLQRGLRDVPGVPESVHKTCVTIERHERHLIRLVDDLLDLSRITSGNVELKVAPAPIEAIIEQAVAISQHLIEQKGHHLNVELPAAPTFVMGDGVRLAQVIGNLLNNAARYTEPGGSLSIICKLKESQIEIGVKDNGRGIAPEHLPHIFDMFMQGQKAADGGIGVGLALVKRLVDLHHGTVVARSEGEGKGSEIVISLSVCPAPAPDLNPSSSSSSLSSSSSTHAPRPLVIALVEDNPELRELMVLLLTDWGHRVEAANDGEAGIELIMRIAPDVALIDVGLPGLSGYDVAARIRAEPTVSRVRLLAVTGFGQEADRRRAMEVGFDAHVTKPPDLDLLEKALYSEDV